MRHATLQAISETAMEHQIGCSVPAGVRHPSLRPELTLPVFSLPKGLLLTEAVAVVYRNEDGKPIDGGLFGVTVESEVVRLALVDTQRGVNTDDNPAWVAFGLTMSIGKLFVKGDDSTQELPWSIVDFGEHAPHAEMPHPTPGRIAVRAAFCVMRAALRH